MEEKEVIICVGTNNSYYDSNLLNKYIKIIEKLKEQIYNKI